MNKISIDSIIKLLWVYLYISLLSHISAISTTTTTLTPDQCAKHQSNQLSSIATSFVNQVDNHLVPLMFNRVVQGYLITVVDEENGIKNGR
jgi:hypothetical protein